MAGRIYHPEEGSNGVRHVNYNISFFPQGAGTPVLGEGENSSTNVGTYVTVARTGVGTYTVTTKDPFVAPVIYTAWVNLAAPAGQFAVCFGTPSQNTNGTWTLPFTIFNGAAAADVAAAGGNRVQLAMTFRNSTSKP